MAYRKSAGSGQQMYRQVQDHLTGADWKGRQNRAAKAPALTLT